MLGVVYIQLHDYIGERFGTGTWLDVLRDAHLEGSKYFDNVAYPDDELVAIVRAAAARTGSSVGDLLTAFGAALAVGFIGRYDYLIAESWGTLDVIEHAEDRIHRVLRMTDHLAEPPKLQAWRASPYEVRLTYTSGRKLCQLLRGFASGIATHFGETVDILEDQCMLAGAASCEFHITKVA